MKKKTLTVVMGGAFAVFVIMGVTASSLMANSPLYTVRMDQMSSEMHFLPTSANGFTYTAENGYTLEYNASGHFCGDVRPLASDVGTCPHSCQGTCWQQTCKTCSTCQGQGWTCDYTGCQNTCAVTCPQTCETTCTGPTCDEPTCPYTCERTCPNTCSGNTCDPPCP